MKQTMIIRADASVRIGAGHVLRCIALGQSWQDKGGRVVFLSHCETSAIKKRILDEGFDFKEVVAPHPDPSDFADTLRMIHEYGARDSAHSTWVVVDGYHFDAAYQKELKDVGYKVLWIDDYGHAQHYYADLILNQNVSVDESLYQHRETYTRLLLGTRYALLRREFREWTNWRREVPEVAQKVLITLGGSDPDNVTLKVIQALKQIDISGLEAKIIVGPANPNTRTLQQEIGKNSNLQLIKNAENMTELMAWADVAIAAGGSTSWELALMGLPSLLVILADNQSSIVCEMSKAGAAINLGYAEKLTSADITHKINTILNESKTRSLLCTNAKALIDGFGASRVCDRVFQSDIVLRPVIQEDCKRIWDWSNDPSVRLRSFSKSFIAWEEHVKWFTKRIEAPFFYVALLHDGTPIGQVRVDISGSEAVISVMIESNYRNQGYGEKTIARACHEVFHNSFSGIKEIHAHVEESNTASFRAFKKAGFREIKNRSENNEKVRHLKISNTGGSFFGGHADNCN